MMHSNYPRPSDRDRELVFSRKKVGSAAAVAATFFLTQVYVAAGIFQGGTFLEKGTVSTWPSFLAATILGLSVRRTWPAWIAPLLVAASWGLIVGFYLLIALSQGRDLREDATTHAVGFAAMDLVLAVASGIAVRNLSRSPAKRSETPAAIDR